MQCGDITWRCCVIDENKYLCYPTEFSMENSVISSKCLLVLWVCRFFDDFHQNDSCFKLRGRILVSFEYSGMFPPSYVLAFPYIHPPLCISLLGVVPKSISYETLYPLHCSSDYQTEVIYYKLNVNPLDDTFEENLIMTGRKKAS